MWMGGVTLYVHDAYKVTRLASSDTEGPGKPGVPEYLMCTVQRGDSDPIFVCVVYRPPSVSFYKNDFLAKLESYCSEYSHKIILGDWNANLLSLTDSAAKLVRRLANKLSLRIVEHAPTHVSPTSSTWIDIILIDSNDEVLDAKVIPATYQNRHNVIDALISVETCEEQHKEITYRDYKNIDPAELLRHLADCDWSPFDSRDSTDPDIMLQCLSANLQGAIEHLAPIKRILPRKGKAPWVGVELQQLYKKRDATYRRYRRTQNVKYLEDFIVLRGEAECRTTEARTNYYYNKLSDALHSNNIWKELRGLGLLPRSKDELNGFSPDDLNRHFASVSISPHENPSLHINIINSADESGFAFKPVTLNDVIISISHFSSQAMGVDGIPQSVITKSIPVIGEYLVALFNSSLRSGTFPSLWREALVVPLKKRAIPSSATDFRPIALLCFLSKVLEKLVHDQMYEYLTSQNLLDPHQTGFRPRSSTQTALLKLTDDIRTGIDKKLITILLQFDFSKAFDKVSPTRLLERLRVKGFSRAALMWLSSYLTNRKQLVKARSGGQSDWIDTNLGVPQGSVLGPLLFCLYIDDLQEVLSDKPTDYILYADDLQIYMHVDKERLDEGTAQLSNIAKEISDWADRASLKLNAGKTKAIIFGSPKIINRLSNSALPGIEVAGGTTVPYSDTVTSLGVTLDSKLNWEPHLDSLTKKFNKVIYSLRFFRKFTTESLRKRLAEALLFPHLDYCSVVYLDASTEQKARLQRLQNTCVRYVTGAKWDDHISPHREKLGWLKTGTRQDYFALLIIYKILRMRAPIYLTTRFKPHVSRNPCRGEMKELAIPHARTEKCRRSFYIYGARLWNSLPIVIRNLPSFSRFKVALRRHLSTLD